MYLRWYGRPLDMGIDGESRVRVLYTTADPVPHAVCIPSPSTTIQLLFDGLAPSGLTTPPPPRADIAPPYLSATVTTYQHCHPSHISVTSTPTLQTPLSHATFFPLTYYSAERLV
jgi:hypothetical protein